MKRLCLLAAVAFLPSAVYAAAGKVSFLEGSASRTPESGAKLALKVGGEVAEGDLVETGSGARVELALPDKSIVRLGPGSRLKLTKAQFTDSGRDFKAKLVVGKVWSKVSSLFGNDRNFEVATERAVAGVRGTVFRVDGDKAGAVLVRVYAGTVAVAGQGPLPAPEVKKGERVQVAGPQQVSKQQWEKIVGAMMQVKVSARGEPGEPTRFAEADELKDAWASWNKKRDEAVQ